MKRSFTAHMARRTTLIGHQVELWSGPEVDRHWHNLNNASHILLDTSNKRTSALSQHRKIKENPFSHKSALFLLVHWISIIVHVHVDTVMCIFMALSVVGYLKGIGDAHRRQGLFYSLVSSKDLSLLSLWNNYTFETRVDFFFFHIKIACNLHQSISHYHSLLLPVAIFRRVDLHGSLFELSNNKQTLRNIYQ